MSPSQSCSHRNSVQNGPIERSTALMATLFVKKHKIDPDPKKMSSSQSCSHRNSVQNGPVDKFTALMATLFVNISVFMSRGPKVQGFCGMRYPDTYTICRYAVSDIYLFLLRISKALRFNNPTRRYAGILIPSKAVCRYVPVWLSPKLRLTTKNPIIFLFIVKA